MQDEAQTIERGEREMRRFSLAVAAAVFLFSGFLVNTACAEETVGGEGSIVLPWDEFRKVLNLDEEKIVLPMETFRKLLAQTGAVTAPEHSVSGGNVVLTRDEFKKLVDGMQPPPGTGTEPPVNHLITKAIYAGAMNRDNTDFTGTFTVHVLGRDAYRKIPILNQNIAMEDIRVNGKEALVVTEGGYHQVVLSRAGEYTVTASFSLKSSLDRGPRKLDLPVQRTPITLLELEIPLKDIVVQIPQAQQLSTRSSDGTTVVRAVISPGNHLSVQWQTKVPAAEKIPPKLYSELYHLVSIEDDVLKIISEISYNILHSEVDEVRIVLPDNMSILSVNGEGVGEWQETEQEGRRLLRVPFTYGKKGRTVVMVTAETPLSETGAGNAFSGFQTLGVVRETGFVGITLNTSAELVVSDIEVLEKVAPQKLPVQLINRSDKPIMLGFKYLKHPYHLVLDVKKHEKVAVPVAAIDSGNVVTLFTEDGKVVHRLVYQVRNSAKQFLEVQLPEGADIWGVFVDNQPVESSITDDREGGTSRRLLVPLVRSRAANGQLATFPVEVVMALSAERFSWVGTKGASLPGVDLLTSRLIWSVYLPNYYGYNYFTSSLEKEEIIRGVNIFSRVQRSYDKRVVDRLQESSEELGVDELRKVYKGKEAESYFRNVPMEQAQVVGQMKAEMDFNGRMGYLSRHDVPPSAGGGETGVLPIMIQVPTSGQVYRFAKTIIKPEDPLTFNVVYSQLWISRLLKWGIFLFLVLLIFRNRGRISEGLKEGGQFFRRHEEAFRRYAGSVLTPFILLGLAVFIWPVAPMAALLLLFLFWVSAAHHLLNLYRKRRTRKTEP
jgi:hypothetical protein